MSALDKFLRKTRITDPTVFDTIKPTWTESHIRARLDKLKMEAATTGRVTPIIEFFDNLNVLVWNAFRLNFQREGEVAEANRNLVLEIWERDYNSWYVNWYESLKEGGEFV